MTIDEAIASLPSCLETGIESNGCEYNAWCENSEYSCPYKLNEIKRVLELQKDAYLRLAADFDNYKKRAEQEKAKAAVAVVEDFAKDLFPHIDNFDTAVRSLKAIGNGNQQFEAGIDLVVGGIMHVLKVHGFEKIQIAVGDAFDVSTCEAVVSEE